MALSLFSSTTHHIFVKLLQQTLQKNLLSVGDVNKSELTVHIPLDPTKLSCKAPLHREILFRVPKLTFTLWWRITETCHEVSPCCMEDAPSTAGVACTGIGAVRAVRLDEKDETWAGWEVVDPALGFPRNFLFPELHLPTNQSVKRGLTYFESVHPATRGKNNNIKNQLIIIIVITILNDNLLKL